MWPYKHKYLLAYFLKHRWAAKKVFLAWPLNCKFFSGMTINYYLWDFTQNRRLFQSVVLPGLFFCLFHPIGSWKRGAAGSGGPQGGYDRRDGRARDTTQPESEVDGDATTSGVAGEAESSES
jgi:hypothetical protein